MFLMLSMLAGLGTITIPVVIHLLHRQKTTPIRWGAMRFLMETRLQQKKRHNIEHWLLMLARMAVLALIVLALARPLLHSDLATPLGGGTSTDFAVVLDHSLSAGRAAEGTSPAVPVFARGVELVDRIANALKPTDTLSVILAEHAPRALNERPIPGSSSDVPKLRESLHQLAPGTTDASIPAGVQAARDVINHGRGVHKKVIVISDEQKTGWQPENAPAWKTALADGGGGVDRNVAVFDLPLVADTHSANLSVGALSIQPTVLGPGRPVQITATISQTGATDLAAVPLTLIVDGKPVATQTVTDIGANASRTVRFDHTFTTAGSHYVQLRADVADALEADNAATLALNVLDKLPVLIIDGQLTGGGAFRSSQFLAAALQPVEEAREAAALVQPKIISIASSPATNFGEYAAVIVNDVPALPAEVLSRLADYARGGRGVWFILGSRTSPRMAGDLTNSGLFPANFGAQQAFGADVQAPPALVVKDPSNRMVSLLTAAERNALTGVVALNWWPVTADAPDARAIVSTTTNAALIFERPVGSAGGRIVLWTSSVDGRWNTLPLAAAFVPLVNETLLHLAGPAVGATHDRHLDSGRPIAWSGPVSPSPMSATLTRPDAPREPVPLKLVTESGRTVARYEGTHAPGLYELRFTPTAIPQPVYYSVSIDPKELDPAVLSSADVSSLKENGFIQARLTADELSHLLAAPGSGSELWPALALATLGLLVLESVMTYRMVRLQAGAAKIV
jgi:hypothetical protein